MEEKIFIRVLNVKFLDLPDWSHPEDKHQNVSKVNSRMNCLKKKSVKVECNNHVIALFRVNNKVYAIQDKCPHQGGPLHLGDIEDVPGEGFCVRCPWHNWRIGLDSGRVVLPHGRKECAVAYPVKIKSCGSILIGFDKFSDTFFDISQDF